MKRGKRRRMVTIRDIARETGLSVATISVVLNQVPKSRRIPTATQQRIREAAKKLGYFPNLIARSLRSARTHTVGLLVFDIGDPYCSVIVRGIERSLYASGYMPVLTDLQNDPKRMRECAHMLMEQRVGGVMAIANPLYFEYDLLNILSEFHVPAVVIGRELRQDGVGSVVIENEVGTFALLKHLYELGHREIAFIKGPDALNDSEPRWNGLCSFAKTVRLKMPADLVLQIQGNNSSYEEGYRLAESLLQSKQKFTALVTFDDLTAFAAIGALTAAGVKVPQDCSVVGFDDIPGAAFYNPPLTTVHQYLEEQGSIGGEMIKALITAGPGMDQIKLHRKVTPTLVIRRSAAPAP
jgi:LacI family transcriptional regulator, galactose operon repressor